MAADRAGRPVPRGSSGSLDQRAAEYEAFTDLDEHLRRYAAPDRRRASEAEIVERVGRWIGETVLGPVGPTPGRCATARWSLPGLEADRILESVFHRDGSPSTVATVLPLLRRIAEATTGTEQKLIHAGRLASALSRISPFEAETHLQNLLDTAISRERFPVASATAGDLFEQAVRGGRLHEALIRVEQQRDFMHRAGLGPWSQLLNERQRLQILTLQGRSDEVLAAVHTLRSRMATLPETSEAEERVVPWHVRESILDVGREGDRFGALRGVAGLGRRAARLPTPPRRAQT